MMSTWLLVARKKAGNLMEETKKTPNMEVQIRLGGGGAAESENTGFGLHAPSAKWPQNPRAC